MDSKLGVDLAEEREETYFWMALRIPHMYWSTSRPSNNAVLLKGVKNIRYNPLEAVLVTNLILYFKEQRFTYLHTGHLHVPLSQLSCK